MKKYFFLGCLVLLCESLQLQAVRDDALEIALTGAINVSTYPVQMQEVYSLFETKCTACHGLKETVRSPSVLPTYWERTVEQMRLKPKSGFSEDEGARITEFLIYDSFERRRVELKKELKSLQELSPEQFKVEQEKLDAVMKKNAK